MTITRFWSRFIAWMRAGRVVLEVEEVSDRHLLATCRCGRVYITPPVGVDDPGACWLCRSERRAA